MRATVERRAALDRDLSVISRHSAKEIRIEAESIAVGEYSLPRRVVPTPEVVLVSETPEEPTTPDLAEPAAQPDAVVQPPLPATATRAQGPVGKPRGTLFVIVLSIVTLGIYHLYWYYKSFEELKRHTGNGIGGILGLLIAIVFNPINWFVLPSEIGSMYRGDGREAPMTGWTGLWILLPLVGWFVWTIKTQGALNRYWASKASS